MRAPHFPRRLLAALTLGIFVCVATVHAQPPPAPPPESHQFDFWLGEWTVTNPAGKLAGTSRIESIAHGFGLLENWTSAGGGSGKSLNTWNAAQHRWQQFWIGSDGDVLELAGGLDAQGRMVLSSEHDANGRHVIDRIAWTPNPDGSVRQLWEQSFDRGRTWQVAFDGHYVKTEAPKKVASAASEPIAGGGGGGDSDRRPYWMFW